MSYEDPILKGDSDRDGSIDATDVTATEAIILGAATNQEADADMGGGAVDMGDVTKIERIIAGLP